MPEHTDGGRIAFQTNRDGNSEIYIMGCDGEDQVNLTNHSSEDKGPSWGNGGRLVFSSNRNSDGGFDIYLLTLDPWGITRLTTNAANDESPALSPDGSKVAYVSYRDSDGDAEIYVLTVSDRSLDQVTSNTAADMDPVWSPDGTKLAFASDSDGDWDIYVADSDGSNVANLTDSTSDDTNGYSDRSPDWGVDVFDDEFIVFSSDRGGDSRIYTMYSDGTDLQIATTNGSADGEPSWDPVAEFLAFHRTSNDNVEVFTMSYGGDEQANISENSDGSDSSPDWEPDDSDVYCGGEPVPTD